MGVIGDLPFSMGEYRLRQDRFLSQNKEDTLVLIPTNSVQIRSNDTSYPYRANSYMLYLCGWSEPEAIFMGFQDSGSWKSCLFVRPRDTRAEIWEGRRVGIEGALEFWPIDEAYSIDDMDKIIQNKISNSNSISTIEGFNKELDILVKKSNLEILDARKILDDLRVIKSEEEIKIMQDAAILASNAHIEAIKKTYPGIGEWKIQSVIESHFSANQSCPSYSSIVGGGDNATILHYNSNNMEISDGDLVLVDAGCEISGYASDITRTWPVNGKFSDEQKEIYNLVLDAEKAAIEACVVGSSWSSMHQASSKVLAQGLIDLGILECNLAEALGENYDGPYRNFFMHGTGHMLGLDVHDVGGGRQGDKGPERLLLPGMVLTVEPGLYFGSWRTDIDIPEKYSGIGIRIEDDVLVTDEGPVILTSSCPKEISEIESLVGEKIE
jgi:Xaa-Pro aminopeptidase